MRFQPVRFQCIHFLNPEHPLLFREIFTVCYLLNSYYPNTTYAMSWFSEVILYQVILYHSVSDLLGASCNVFPLSLQRTIVVCIFNNKFHKELSYTFKVSYSNFKKSLSPVPSGRGWSSRTCGVRRRRYDGDGEGGLRINPFYVMGSQ